TPATPARPANLTLQEYVDWFSFDGTMYPFLKTSMGKLDEEQLAQTANHAYRSNGLIFALVMARMQVLSQIRFAWTRYEGGQPADLFGTEALRLLERPWVGGTTADLLARMEVDVSLAGTAYIRKITPSRAQARAGATPRLVRLRPEWVIAVMGSDEDAEHPAEAADVELLGYAYKPPSGPMVILGTDEVAMFALLPDPDRVFLGMSWVTATLRELQADQAQTEHKLAYFRNSATPNLALRFDPSITIEQVREFKELFEADHVGTWNAWRTLYLGGGAEPMPIGANLRDLDYSEVAGKAESRLAAASGVPPSWVGFSEGLQGSALNAGNFNSARRRFSDGTAHHWWTNAARSLEPLVADPVNARGASLWFDTSAVPFLREDAKDQAEIQANEAQTIASLVRDGFEPASVIDAVRNHDWRRLRHSGLMSVQLVPPGEGTEPTSNGNGKPPADLRAR
ncbi:MAG TPA: phage portal protein, partial [Actinomycetota bacterium]|nr:phage portal protein [Actinomycetota bacterium]